MKAIAILPARLGASRFPGKPMARILGMPMIGHCYFRTKLAPGLAGTYVATCDDEIAAYMRRVGGDVVMTSSSHRRASDRTAEAMNKIEEQLGLKIDVVIMVQGDEPLILPETISDTLRHFSEPGVDIVNIMSRLRTFERFVDKNNVKVVVDGNMDALYFSREPIPSPWKGNADLPMYMQVGVIAFRRDALEWFRKTPETRLEQIESVDMNRVLESGRKIRMVLTESETLGVDTPDELRDAERLLQGDPIVKKYMNT